MTTTAPMNSAFRMMSYPEGRSDFTPAQQRRIRKKRNHHEKKQAQMTTPYFMKG